MVLVNSGVYRMDNKDDNRVLDEKRWRIEAEGVINDVRNHVKVIRISTKLSNTSSQCSVYLNLTTLEEFDFCVELSSLGFNIVDNKHDSISLDREYRYFETPYSLLEHISPRYTQSFGTTLFDKLRKLGGE